METNLNAYNLPQTQRWYGELKGLTIAEMKIFENAGDKLKEGKVLDIGVGGGRTTAELINRCGEYDGIDYSPLFVQQCKQRFPNVNIQCMDARNLNSLGKDRFDLVNFSFNGIDYVNNEDRLKILKEIHSVMKPGGLFFFSTHNRSHFMFNRTPWSNKEKPFYYNLKTFLRFAPFIFKKFIHKKKELTTKDYSLIIDHAHNYSLVTFYTEPGYLREQLTISGFTGIKLFDKNGEESIDEKLDDWIYVTALKSSF